MSLTRTNPDPILTRDLIRRGFFDGERLCLMDVGASGGIENTWDVFKNHRRVFGFEPLIAEAQRLAANNQEPDVEYINAFVGYAPYAELLENDLARQREAVGGVVPSNQPFPRTSATLAIEVAKINYVEDYFNRGQEEKYASEKFSLDEFVRDRDISSVDFIKIDTDGSDYEVLLGARDMLASTQVLGLSVECQFHGTVSRQANLFSNIDLFLRERGFSLFDIDLWRYTRAALPGRFVYDIPAQTHQGQIMWGEALYLRDLGDDTYEEQWKSAFSTEKILKLFCFFEIFGLPDCMAELLFKHEQNLKELGLFKDLIGLLSPSFNGQKISFDRYREEFSKFVRQRKFLKFPGFD